jgi:hypothetical protein
MHHDAWLLLAVLAALPVMAAAQTAGPPKAQNILETLYKPHPRLMLHDDALAALRSRIDAGDDKAIVKCYRDLIRRADDHLRKPKLRYKKIGPRLLNVSRDCLHRTYVLGLAWRLTGKDKYAKAATENLLAACAFKDWNPSHFLDTAEMSHAVGVGYDWLHGYLDDKTRQAIREGLIRNGLEPGVKAYGGRKPMWWTRSPFNWNQVCNGGLICGALAIAETDPKYAERIVSAAVKSLPKALASYAPDGAWGEGPGYWGYATNYTVFAFAALDSALGSDFGLSEAKGLDKAGRFPVLLTGPTGQYLNFADVGERGMRRDLPVLFWLAKRYDDKLLAWAEHRMLRERTADPRHLIWYVPRPKTPPKAPPRMAFFDGSVQVAIARTGWDDGAGWVGIKAGYNRVNHGHLDLGNFELEAFGVRWARDLGKDDYNLPSYWDGGRDGGTRWTYYRLNSHSHNVCTLDGRNQNVAGKAKFLVHRGGEHEAVAVIDLTSAYTPKAKRAWRGMRLDFARGDLLIQDEFELAKPADVVWGMTTDAKITLRNPAAMLEQDGKRLYAAIVSPADASFEVASAEQKPPQEPNKGVRRLLIRLKQARGDVRIAVIFAGEVPNWAIEPKPLAQWR